MKKLGKKLNPMNETLEAFGTCYCYGACTSTSASYADMYYVSSMREDALSSWY